MIGTLCMWGGRLVVVTGDRVVEKDESGRIKLDKRQQPVVTGKVTVLPLEGGTVVDPAELEPLLAPSFGLATPPAPESNPAAPPPGAESKPAE